MRTKCLILSVWAVFCSAASFPDYPVKPASEYPAAIEKSGYVVAAIPVEDRNDQRKYFGLDLRSRGLIPLFLLVENRTADNSVLLKKDSLMYSPAGKSGSTLPDAAKSSRVDKTVTALSYVPSVYMFMSIIVSSKTKERRQHLLETELQSATVSPGQSVHGFIFLPAKRGYLSRKKMQLNITLVKSGSDDVVTIDATI
jgi:hypothetical protein